MSYLDLPHLHFSGLFFTAPSTINNITQNYIPTTQLESANNQYIKDVVGWNPNGVAQWWLEECSVLSGVGPSGTAVTSSGADPVIGVPVLSPSPSTPMSDGKTGYFDFAKLVDLDPDQQGRSAGYGVRIAVTLPNGAGFQGLMTVPELRQLNGRVSGARSSYGAVGNWMGTVQNVVWSGDVSGSALLTALKSAAANGLAVKMTIDLHQNNTANQFTAGDLFCYGRVLGTIGPALAGELAQVVPGRCLQPFTPSAPATPQPMAEATGTTADDERVLQGRDLVVARTAALAPMADFAEAAAAPPDPWNPAFCVIRGSLLNIDIGGCMLLQSTGSGSAIHSDGTFVINDGIVVGVMDPTTQAFTPFTNGAVNFTNGYQTLTSNSKNCQLVTNSGVFTIPLTPTDVNNAKATPLAISVNGTIVAAETPDGSWMDVAVSAERLQCGGASGQDQIMVRQFGNPVVGQPPPVTAVVQVVQWSLVNNRWRSSTVTSTDLTITLGNTDANGIAAVTTAINVASLTLPAIRQPLDSVMYYVFLVDANGNVIGDGSPTISVLLWDAFTAPSTPTWADVGPVLGAYARLYPGMKSLLDIGDEATVKGFAPVLLARMSAPMLDPGFMPVTRDLSPTKTNMVVSWLKSVI
jgi:hypothetical protein